MMSNEFRALSEDEELISIKKPSLPTAMFEDRRFNGRKTKPDKARLYAIASSIKLRMQQGKLTRISAEYLNETPAISGIYIAVSLEGEILYVGMSEDLSRRCNLIDHHKLPLAIGQGFAFILIAGVASEDCWHVEQVLIDNLKPKLNERCDAWWKSK